MPWVLLPFPELHPEVEAVAKSLYESGHFTEALRSASIRLEEVCKAILKEKTGKEETGTVLMAKLFCQKDWKALVPFVNLSLEWASAKQESHYFLFSGFAWAIRNKLAHSTEKLDDIEALYWLNIASYLFYKLDRARELNEILPTPIVIPQDQSALAVQETNTVQIEDFILSLEQENRIQEISTKTPDRSNARLTLEKILQEILLERIDNLWSDSYNAFSNEPLKQEIINILITKLYGPNN